MKAIFVFLCVVLAQANIGALEGNTELVKAVNAAIARLDNVGKIDAMIKNHFGDAAEKINFRSCWGVQADHFWPYPKTPRMGGSLDVVLRRQELRLAADWNKVPFLMHSASSATFSGFHNEFAEEVAREIGIFYGKAIKVRWVQTTQQLQNSELYKGTVDLTWDLTSTVGVFEEQHKANIWEFPCSVLADQPAAIQGGYQRMAGLGNLSSLAAANFPNVIIAGLKNSHHHQIWNMTFPNAQFKWYDTYNAQYNAVFSQTASAHVFLSDSHAAAEVEEGRFNNTLQYNVLGAFGKKTPIAPAARKDGFSINKAIPCGKSSCGGLTCQS